MHFSHFNKLNHPKKKRVNYRKCARIVFLISQKRKFESCERNIMGLNFVCLFFLIKYSFAKYSDLEIKKFLFDVNKIRKKIAQSFRQKQMHQENCMPCLLEVCYALTQFQSRDNKKKEWKGLYIYWGLYTFSFFFMREGLVRKKLEKIFF